jgi:hypothetical protein
VSIGSSLAVARRKATNPSSNVVAANAEGALAGTMAAVSFTRNAPVFQARSCTRLTPPTLPTLCQGGVT